MLRVLVVDDSPVARNLLTQILDSEPDFEVVGTAANGVEAVQNVSSLRPDVITMDVQMPRMDGYAATREIMTICPTPIVVVSGSMGKVDVEKSILSLDAGALAVIGKPGSPISAEFEQSARKFVETVRSMAAVRVIRRHLAREPAPTRPAPSITDSAKLDLSVAIRLVTIAASTGGPHALRTILGQLPGDYPLPIVIVQHISLGFTDGLASWLQGATELNVKLAEDGEQLNPGHVYLAPEDVHCGINSAGKVALSKGPALSGFRPSATVLFESASRAYGSAHIAVILTGMGKDGVEGLRAVKQTKGTVIAQDEASCVVYGMPKAAIDEALAVLIVPLDQIAAELIRLAQLNRQAE